MVTKLFLFTLYLLAKGNLSFAQEEEDTRLTCRLEWVQFGTGNAVPDIAMQAQGSSASQSIQYVIRSNSNIVGRYDKDSGIPYISIDAGNGTAEIPSDFQLLTNPYGCLTFWTNVDAQFCISSGSSGFVGRTQHESQWYPGQIEGSMITIPAPEINNGTYLVIPIQKSGDFLYLISYSNGLLLTMEDFIYDDSKLASTPDFMSQDEINNNSPALVSQIISHEKRIYEKLSITITVTTVSKNTTTVRKNVIINNKKVETEETYIRTESRTYITETETNVTASLELVVPPFSSVKACSLINIAEGVEMEYVATGYYTAPGLSSQEVYDLVSNEGIPELEFKDDKVFVPVRGKMSINLAMTTRFVVIPGDSEGDACSATKRKSVLQ